MDEHDPRVPGSGVDIFTILERTCSVLSITGSMFVLTTFTFSKAFHKPINRLVFYATIGNLMTNVATLMARSFITDVNSFGCQLQGFLIQMFMPADALWMLAMAVNVYLTFYFKFDAQRLRRMEIPYLLCCYGIPFVVALTMVLVSTPEKGRMFGNATLWCWTAPNWDIFRIAIFYGPVWVVISITFFIYIRAGREIYKKHKQLKEFSYSASHPDPEPLFGIEDLFSSTKTTEVYVTTEVIDKPGAIDLAPLGGGERRRSQLSPPQKPPRAAYSVTISSNRNRESHPDAMVDAHVQPSVTTDISAGARVEPGPGAGTGLVRTTTGASIKPISTTITVGTGNGAGNNNNNNNAIPLRRRAAYEASNATWSYTKCAILFFTALCVTWIPSSANRVYSVVHAGEASLTLEYVAAFVLPLQGWWNAIIYCVTSWGACKMLWADIRAWWWGSGVGGWFWWWFCCGCARAGGRGRGGNRGTGRRRRRRNELMGGGGRGVGGGMGMDMDMHGLGKSDVALQEHGEVQLHRSAFQRMGGGGGRGGGDSKMYETESMTELAGSRPGTSGSPMSDATAKA